MWIALVASFENISFGCEVLIDMKNSFSKRLYRFQHNFIHTNRLRVHCSHLTVAHLFTWLPHTGTWTSWIF